LVVSSATGPGPTPTVPPASGRQSVPSKSAGLAAFLNLFFGLGYVYLGYRRVLGVPTIVFVILTLVVYFLIGIFSIGLATLVLAILLAIDGYQKGQGHKGFISAEY
jgi:hypothetical protein